MMLEALALRTYERVLEIGTGSGYQAALLGYLAREVYTIELLPELARSSKRILHELGFANVHVIEGDGALGYARAAPYDGIISAAATPAVPDAWLEQLTEGGRLIVPLGERNFQRLMCIERRGREITTLDLGPCLFVPLLGPAAPEDGDRLSISR